MPLVWRVHNTKQSTHLSTPVASPCRALCQWTGRNSTLLTLRSSKDFLKWACNSFRETVLKSSTAEKKKKENLLVAVLKYNTITNILFFPPSSFSDMVKIHMKETAKWKNLCNYNITPLRKYIFCKSGFSNKLRCISQRMHFYSMTRHGLLNLVSCAGMYLKQKANKNHPTHKPHKANTYTHTTKNTTPHKAQSQTTLQV